MPLHPLAQAFLEQQIAVGARPTCELSVEQARQQAIALTLLQGIGEPAGKVEDSQIPAPDGFIPIRVYTPGGNPPFPILVYFHGGGWVLGNLDSNGVLCRMLTNAAQCVVVSVNYHHAPEYKFPAAAEDAFAATQWVSKNAGVLNGDPARVAVGGASAGGNLAAVVTLMARDRGAPPLIYQLLMVPVTNYAFDTPSYRDNGEGYGLTRDTMRYLWSHYLPTGSDGHDPYASPLQAASLEDLPPAHILIAEFDPLRDEGEAYAARLAQSNVPTLVTRCAGMVHGFWGDQALGLVAQDLREALWTVPRSIISRARVITQDGTLVESE